MPKHYVAHWALSRAVQLRDVLQCASNASTASAAPDAARDDWRVAKALAAPVGRYDIQRELCKGHDEPPDCKLQPWARAGGAAGRRRSAPVAVGARHNPAAAQQLLTPPDHVPMAPDHLP